MEAFRYEQSSGRFLFESGGSFRLAAVGYAGAKGFVNNPDADHLHSKGPLPKGTYRIKLDIHPRFAAPAFRLIPTTQSQMHGRSGFWIHGDNLRLDRSASSGCIILGYHFRTFIERRLSREPSRNILAVV